MALDKPYADIPGTTIFDADQARMGYHLNQFCMSLMKVECRERFKSDERAYLDVWPMTEDQKQAVLDRDYNRMIELGGNVYFLAKIFLSKRSNCPDCLRTSSLADSHETNTPECPSKSNFCRS